MVGDQGDMAGLSLPERLLVVMKRAGLTQEQLAERLFVDPRTVRRWLSGDSVPKKETLAAVEAACGQPPGTLSLDPPASPAPAPSGGMDAQRAASQEPTPPKRAVADRALAPKRTRLRSRAVLVGLIVVALIVGLVAGLGLFSDSPDYNVRDDFSDPDSGWKRSDNADELAAYTNGGYRLVRKRSGLAFSPAPASLTKDLPTKVRVAVRATQMPGATGSVGVFCRMSAGLQYAGLLDTTARRWKIGKVAEKGQPLEELLPGSTGPMREGTNDIALECSGGESSGAPVLLRLLINGTEVGMKEDPKGLPLGQVGVEVITGGNQPVEALFDDFAVSAL